MTPNGTPAERSAIGRQERQLTPLAAHSQLAASAERRAAVTLLDEQAGDRLAELIPIRYGRMLVSPLTFYRGAARVMASDLALGPSTSLNVQLCGDAHLSNFGLFASPERRLVFDVNDFDETLPGPFEWDLKRLVASLVITAREGGFKAKQRRAIAQTAVARYRTAMAQFAAMRSIEIWHTRLDTANIERELAPQLDAKRQKRLNKAFMRARTRDSAQAQAKLTEKVNGHRRLVGNPPLIVPLRDLLPEAEWADQEEWFRDAIRQYRRTLQYDTRVLLGHYRFVDMARKVVGVGSVGTRCWIVLLAGRDENDPLILQVKEASESVLTEFLGRSEHANQGQRVVTGQQLMQQSSDIFLGWQRTAGLDEIPRDFYFRQLRDWKGSIDVEALTPEGLRAYGEFCAWSLARAHARSGDPVAIAAYLGDTDAFDRAVAEFAESYADINERDHQAMIDAAASGAVEVRAGL